MSFLPLLLIAVVPLVSPHLLQAQRQPVLRQIKVPHSYYYREMYLTIRQARRLFVKRLGG